MSVVADRTQVVDTPVAPVRRARVHRPPARHRMARPRAVACPPRQPRLSFAWLLVTAAVVCAAVYGLGMLAGSVGPSVPEETTVVRVKPGESLWELAGRVAPESDAAAVVSRIRELNGVDGAVQPGQPLTVPFSG